MIKLVCKDFGFECDFEAVGTIVSQVIELFEKHTLEEHRTWHSRDKIRFMLKNRSENIVSKKEIENFFNRTYAELNRLEK